MSRKFGKFADMDKKLAAEIDAVITHAKASGNNWKFTVKSGNTSSLNKVIKTQSQADLFMTLLKAQSKK
jgi:hypothetical protein